MDLWPVGAFARPPLPFSRELPNMRLSAILAIIIASAGIAMPALAHSLKEVEDQLTGRDKYFQPVDQPAPGFTLVNADGQPVSLPDFRGKVVVLNFIYTRCGDVCPLHSVVIAQLQSMINNTPMRDRVAFISITTDPKTDRGAVLTEYGTAHGLDPVNWTFLTSAADQPEDTTRKVAKAYGLEFTETGEGTQMHGIVTHVIDKQGRMRGRFHGLKFEPLTLVSFVNALVNDYDHPHPEPKPDSSLWSWFTSLFSGPAQPSQGAGQ